MRTHIPYRSWCPFCVKVRCKSGVHQKLEKSDEELEKEVPVISFDYCFISDQGDVADTEGFEAAGEGAAKVLVGRDSRSKAVFAHVVPAKGADEKGFAVSALTADVKWLGYSRLTLKSDNEPAIVRLLSESLRELRVQGVEQALEEHSPEYDPQANGSAEVRGEAREGPA